MHRYFLLNKPVGVVSQFKSSHSVKLLGALDFEFPEGIHAIGRLDINSEGLLLLTTDKRVTKLLFDPLKSHERKYLVMVQHKVSPESLNNLRMGVQILISKNEYYLAKPLAAEIIAYPADLYPYAQDNRSAYDHTWLLITLAEGKFRQVRKMVSALRHRCLRLVRVSICNIHLGSLAPGEVKEISSTEFFGLLGIDEALH